MKLAIVTVLIALATSAQAENLLLQDRLAQSGARCRSTTEGQICIFKKRGANQAPYPEDVAILIPTNVRRPDQMILHLHGHRVKSRRDGSLDAILNDFDFLKRMKEAGATNSVMIVPLSNGNCDTYRSQWGGSSGKFTAFTNWVTKQVNATREQWILTGHSGAFAPIAQILRNDAAASGSFIKKLRAVGLFDATYGNNFDTSVYKQARSINPELDIGSVYRPNLPGTQSTTPGSRKLKRDLGLTGDQVFQADPHKDVRSLNHYDMVGVYYSDYLSRVNSAAARPTSVQQRPGSQQRPSTQQNPSSQQGTP